MRITAAPTVQPISSFVLPWICAAVRPLRARYLPQRLQQRALDAREDEQREHEDHDVERLDAVGVRRAAGLREQEAGVGGRGGEEGGGQR